MHTDSVGCLVDPFTYMYKDQTQRKIQKQNEKGGTGGVQQSKAKGIIFYNQTRLETSN